MAPVAGRPFLAHQMDYWISQGVKRFVLSVGYMHEQIQSHFGAIYRGIDIAYAIEEKPRGTGGGFLLAMEKIGRGRPVLLLNGDTFFEVDLEALLHFHRKNAADWTLSLFHSEDKSRYLCIELDQGGRIVALNSTRGARKCLANGGVYLIERTLEYCFNGNGANGISLESDLLPLLLSSGETRCFGFVSPGRFIDIGVPEDYQRAASMLQMRDVTNDGWVR